MSTTPNQTTPFHPTPTSSSRTSSSSTPRGARHLRALPSPDAVASTESGGLPGRFELRYQPTYAFETGEVVGCEALLRWNHPVFGLLRPQAALAGTRWAELLADVEGWVVAEAARQRAAWRAEGLSVSVAVNASHARVRSGALAVDLLAALEAHGLEEGDLGVDVDAWGASADAELDAGLGGLADLGVAVALQVGMSAVVLPDVIHHAITAFKVPVHLAARSDGRTPHRTVVDAARIARRSHRSVIAANVETSAQVHAARSIGIDVGYGHLLAPAVTAAQLSSLVREATPERRSA